MKQETKKTQSKKITPSIKYFLFSLITIFMATSCLDDDGYSLDKFWIDYGVIEGTKENFTIVTDNGLVLFPSATAISLEGLEDGMRVLVNYTILGDATKPSEIDHYVKINGMRKVLKKGLITLTPEIVDSIGNDGVRIDNTWLTPTYDLLNIEFSYEGSPYHTHFINLVIDPEDAVDDQGNVILQLRHYKKGDPYTRPLLNSVASFDLRSIRKEGTNEVGFRLKAKNIPGLEDYNQTGVYKYTEETDSK